MAIQIHDSTGKSRLKARRSLVWANSHTSLLGKEMVVERVRKGEGVLVRTDECRSELMELVGRAAPIKRVNYSIAATHIGQGGKVVRHHHAAMEEIYLFIRGGAIMTVNEQKFDVMEGDIVTLSSGDRHELASVGEEGVDFFAISLPAYSNADFIEDGDKDGKHF